MKTIFTKTHILASMLFCTTIFYAQSPSFAWAKKVIKTTAASDAGTQSIAIDTLGNVYTAGYFYGTYNFDQGVTNFSLTSVTQTGFILKQDASGNFLWAKKIDNDTDLNIAKIAIDKQNNVYVTGYYRGVSDLDPTTGVATFTSNGITDCFMIKLDPAGNFIWANSFGGTGFDLGVNFAFDAANNVYVLGSFENTVDFDPNIGTSVLTSVGDYDVFLSKLDTYGNLFWVKSFGGSDADTGGGIQIDAQGNIYINGSFQGSGDFNPNAGTHTLSSVGAIDLFMLKLNNAGNLAWAKSMGSTTYDNGADLALDKKGTNIYLTGQFENTIDFDPNAGTTNLSSAGSADIYINKFDTAGTLIWAKNYGGTGYDRINGIKLDSIENIYVSGTFDGTSDFDPSAGVANLTSNGGMDLYVSKLDSNGVLQFAKSFGGVDFDLMKSIDIDKHGSIYTTGLFTGTVNFDPNGTFNLSAYSAADFDTYIQKLNQSTVTRVDQIKNNQNSISLFPNPNNGTLNIALENKNADKINMSIINNLGEVILENSFNTSTFKVNTTELISGVYFVRLIKNNEQEIIKFIKE